MSAVHPDMMYNHDNWDFICYLESAYPNCMKTTAWQIILRNALQTFRMPLFEKWALTRKELIDIIIEVGAVQNKFTESSDRKYIYVGFPAKINKLM